MITSRRADDSPAGLGRNVRLRRTSGTSIEGTPRTRHVTSPSLHRLRSGTAPAGPAEGPGRVHSPVRDRAGSVRVPQGDPELPGDRSGDPHTLELEVVPARGWSGGQFDRGRVP